MTNLKINGVPTPYWCVVVPKDASDIQLHRATGDKVWLTYYQDGIGTLKIFLGEIYPVFKIGCITLSSMDEWVREVVEGIEEYNGVWAWKDYAHESALSLLTHNQITLTADTKAVVIKNIS